MNSANIDDDPVRQCKSVISLYESDIPVEIIAIQLDLEINDVLNIIKDFQNTITEKKEAVIQASKASKLGMLLIDPVFNIDAAITDAQKEYGIS